MNSRHSVGSLRRIACLRLRAVQTSLAAWLEVPGHFSDRCPSYSAVNLEVAIAAT